MKSFILSNQLLLVFYQSDADKKKIIFKRQNYQTKFDQNKLQCLSFINWKMSYIFQKVYFPLIQNLINGMQKQQDLKNSSKKKKHSASSFHSVQKEQLSTFKQNIFRSQNKRSSQSIRSIYQGFVNLSQKQCQSLENQKFLQNKADNIPQQNLENDLLYKSQKKQKENDEKFRKNPKQTFASNASSYYKSQKLQSIFQSVQKNTTRKSISMKKGNFKSSNQRDFDVLSIKSLRKSFCLSIVQNEQQWENSYSKSFRNKK